ncbi:hypothetical protein [Micromonospora sp. WMMD1155]|uniref:hypothetical protein n=1 Tax=Micromonospora sp. WMMD1155 TaxID=3016094 RepID=UPI00249C06AF|nr:hypothetical protein [Micromonospora sp. WMMD1155]WFE53820.1 hypothetical protein O7617_27345 [Micromonospora sp. WMMD1155]
MPGSGQRAGERVQWGAAVRERFETTWVRDNVVRAVASTGAFGLLAWALVVSARHSG